MSQPYELTKCPGCGGTGVVLVPYRDLYRTDRYGCAACEGYGYTYQPPLAAAVAARAARNKP